MKLLFAAGGTAGHINPALAIAAYAKEHIRHAEILFVGNREGMESHLVQDAGFDFAGIEVHGFQRSFAPEDIKKNMKAAVCAVTSGFEAKKIIEAFKPDVAIGTGGYVSGPVIRKAAQMGVKTLIHEQNAFPGVTTKLLSKKADVIFLAVEEARKYLPGGRTYQVVGNPVREEILFTHREAARKELGLRDELCILSYGGSLGARPINEAVADLMQRHYQSKKIYHVHSTGKVGHDDFLKMLEKRGVDQKADPNIQVKEYITNMGTYMAAADLIISRAGAITLSEIEAASKASILIPSPYVAENHQYHNAMVLVRHGAAVVIEEKDLTGKGLIAQVEDFVEHPEKLAELSAKAGSLAVVDTTQKIIETIKKIAL